MTDAITLRFLVHAWPLLPPSLPPSPDPITPASLQKTQKSIT
jgi:hypothetical protein